ncbi:MAG: trehalose-phosphatase [Streptosporangiaceae bacterium]
MASRPSAIEALAAAPAAAALVLDFDGVLAPIIEDPEASAIPEPTAASLASLAASLGLVAVISGRPAGFLADRVRVPGIDLLGSYGMERLSGGRPHLDPAVRGWLGAVAAAGQLLAEELQGVPGIRIEAKPASIAVHWRQAPDQVAAANLVRGSTGRAAAQTGLRLTPGKLVEELRPPVDIDKGSAVAALISAARPGAVAYAGDDLGDIPALRVVREAGGYTLVVDHGAETHPRLLTVADEVFPGTPGFADWLAALAAAAGAAAQRE